MVEKTQSYYYCKAYRDAIKDPRWKDRLPEKALHDRAQKMVDGSKFVLTVEEYRKVNKWLDEQYPVRTKKEEVEKVKGLFDV